MEGFGGEGLLFSFKLQTEMFIKIDLALQSPPLQNPLPNRL